MDTIIPIVLVCFLPLLWTALVFALGRWSGMYHVQFQRRDRTGHSNNGAVNSPYYQEFYEEGQQR